MPKYSVSPTSVKTGGRRTVVYTNSKGKQQDAVVVGGAGTALDLHIRGGGGASRRLTGVAKRTSIHQTNRWHYAH